VVGELPRNVSSVSYVLGMLTMLLPFSRVEDTCTEAKFLDVIGTKVLRAFLLEVITPALP
jgi:hypothetical protein